MAARIANVDSYIASFPPDVRAILKQVRTTIRRALPGSEERISYGMPTVTLDGKPLVYFAGWKGHVSIYPLPAADGATAAELARYRSGKGTARFKISEPIPYDLIERIVRELAAQR
jgi:uncharacterized protein YdhG (YjbR/CyaY superfamily)